MTPRRHDEACSLLLEVGGMIDIEMLKFAMENGVRKWEVWG